MKNKPATAARIAQLMEEHASSLVIYASQWTRQPEDCVQEAFVQLGAQSGEPNHVVGWLYRVVRNKALNALRSEQRRSRHERSAAELNSVVAGPIESDDHQDVLDAVNRLPDELREVVVLRAWSSLGWEEIGSLTEMSSSTAYRRYTTALGMLKNALERECPTGT